MPSEPAVDVTGLRDAREDTTHAHASKERHTMPQNAERATQHTGEERGSAHTAAPADPAAPTTRYAAQIEQLQSMFPDTERRVLEQVVEQYRGSIESEISDPDYQPSAEERVPRPGDGPYPVASASPPRKQQWDPAQLRYSPRVMRPRAERPPAGRTPSQPAPGWTGRYAPRDGAYASMQPYGRFADESPIGDPSKLQEDLSRLTEVGFAKVSSALGQLRQRAQHAMRSHVQDGRARAQHPWASGSLHGFDQDPTPVHDRELDRLARGEAPTVPVKEKRAAHNPGAPHWGQRAPAAFSGAGSSDAAEPPLTWDDVGKDDEEPSKADLAKADAQQQIRAQLGEQSASCTDAAPSPEAERPAPGAAQAATAAAPPAMPTPDAAKHATDEENDRGIPLAPRAAAQAEAQAASATAPPKASPPPPTAAAAPLASSPTKHEEEEEEEEYVHNPFDDEDE